MLGGGSVDWIMRCLALVGGIVVAVLGVIPNALRRWKAMMPSVKGKNVLIVGVQSGNIGFYIAQFCVSLGAHVTIASRNKSGQLSSLAEVIGEVGTGTCQYLTIDVASREDDIVRSLEDQAAFDIIVWSVAFVKDLDIISADEEALRENARSCFDINASAYAHLMRSLIRAGKLGNDARVLVMSSLAERLGTRSGAAYAASKAGLRRLAESLEMWAKKNGHSWRTTYVLCGAVNTGLWNDDMDVGKNARQKMADPEKVAKAAVDGLMRGKREIIFEPPMWLMLVWRSLGLVDEDTVYGEGEKAIEAIRK